MGVLTCHGLCVSMMKVAILAVSVALTSRCYQVGHTFSEESDKGVPSHGNLLPGLLHHCRDQCLEHSWAPGHLIFYILILVLLHNSGF